MPKRPPALSSPPTNDELRLCLEMAHGILADPDQDWFPANSFKLLPELEALGLGDYEARTAAFRRACSEIKPEDFEPPEAPGTSKEQACKGTPMLPFIWDSGQFDRRMYFKFGLQREGFLYIFSLHPPKFEALGRGRK